MSWLTATKSACKGAVDLMLDVGGTEVLGCAAWAAWDHRCCSSRPPAGKVPCKASGAC